MIEVDLKVRGMGKNMIQTLSTQTVQVSSHLAAMVQVPVLKLMRCSG